MTRKRSALIHQGRGMPHSAACLRLEWLISSFGLRLVNMLWMLLLAPLAQFPLARAPTSGQSREQLAASRTVGQPPNGRQQKQLAAWQAICAHTVASTETSARANSQKQTQSIIDTYKQLLLLAPAPLATCKLASCKWQLSNRAHIEPRATSGQFAN